MLPQSVQPRSCIATALLCLTISFGWSGWALAQSGDVEFFESRIRPILIDHCYECHNSVDTAEADLAVDWRDGIRSETASGRAVVPFQPQESLLLQAIRHEIEGLEMPVGGPALSPAVIDDFEQWIKRGATDPRNRQPTSEQHNSDTSWQSTLARRRKWWSFQPLIDPPVPPADGWSDHPIDRFIKRRLRENSLTPAPRADQRILLRRLCYAMTGLPPTPQQVQRFLDDPRDDAWDHLVTELLSSPRYGEHWARHWLDLMRYADSHGSEGDPPIPHAYQYRDYLIRAFNEDVPYDQLVREHIAGDLLENPRVNEELGINESAVGTAHWRLVFHGFAPTDALDEKVRFTDDQINVLGKAFQGLTISCARCHDHKFDAISQADYYALFGVLDSCRPAMQDVNLTAVQDRHKFQLQELKSELREVVADQWLLEIDQVAQRLNDLQSAADAAGETLPGVIAIWQEIRRQIDKGTAFQDAWQAQQNAWAVTRQALEQDQQVANVRDWNLADPVDYQAWFKNGNGLAETSDAAGQFTLAHEGDQLIAGIYPAGIYTHLLSTMHRGVLGSPPFQLDGEYEVWFHVAGAGQATVRYVVQNYPRDGTVYPINNIGQPDWYWHRYDLGYWTGDQVHLELATSRDAPLKVGNEDRSWFGLRRVIVREHGQPAPVDDALEVIQPLLVEFDNAAPTSLDELAEHYTRAIHSAVMAWRDDRVTDAQAVFLNSCLQSGLLVNSLPGHQQAAGLVQRYRELESQIPRPTRVPGVTEAVPHDHPLFHRGDHKRPGETIPRRYLEAIDATPFGSSQSGRLKLAEALLDDGNPLTPRVIVNRIWHHLFGAGIVSTPDNFGQLGDQASHPELLDFLATRMKQHGWSIKDMIRFIVTSRTWQQQSMPSSRAREIDPQNRWLSHANVRRLTGEAIRDTLLQVSGELDDSMFGPGMAANSPEGKRRSVYIEARRNSLDAFLQAFDAPVPFATTGRRDVTNVPAQSLILMNDPMVIQLARTLGEKFRQHPDFDDNQQRQRALFEAILGRSPTSDEAKWLDEYARTTTAQLADRQRVRMQLGQRREAVDTQINAIIQPLRDRLLKEAAQAEDEPIPDAIARWCFTDGVTDIIGDLHAELRGDAGISEGGLELSGSGFAITPPINLPIQEKTLEVWLRLQDLDQRGGGAATIQDLQGNEFDSIVIGEQTPRHWIAGSDHFRRTQDLAGHAESITGETTIHFAIAYDTDGTIRAYRNGQVYGKPYRKPGPVTFAAGQSQIVFGLRHGLAVADGRMFRGTIVQACLYDRALSAGEIAASAAGQVFVGRNDVLDAMSASQRQELARLEQASAELQEQLAQLGPPTDATEIWQRLAHALYNLKEFIFIQ